MKNSDGVIFSMDIGGTNMRSAFVDSSYNIYHFNTHKSNDVFKGDAVKNFINHVHQMIESSESFKKQLKAISVGFPSTVDSNCRSLISTPNIQGLNNINIADIIEREFEVPAFINRDVCMLMLYDMYTYDLPKDAIIIACYIGTGYGNSICIGGKILAGKNGVAAELGHIPILGVDEICGCGNVGCVETIASGMYLSKLQKEYFPDTDIELIFEKCKEHALIKDFIKALAVPVATEINIFDPHYILLGGGVLQMKGFPREDFESAIVNFSRKPLPASNLQFIYPTESRQNGVVGAAIFGYGSLR